MGRTKENGFQINADKCFYTILTFKHANPTLKLFIDGRKIRKEENLVYLGVTLDKMLTGKARILREWPRRPKRG
jgi:hypothetical protein